MSDKTFYVEYEFPELPGGVMYQNVRIEASDIGLACHRGLKEIRKRKGVKGRRISTAKVRVVELTAPKVTEV
jgi:hypothetical protein